MKTNTHSTSGSCQTSGFDHANPDPKCPPVFNPLLLSRHSSHEFYSPVLTSYCYKNYAIGFTIEVHCGHPHRVLSVTPHGFNPQPMDGDELAGILEHFGFYDFLPLENSSIGHPEDPYTGDTQYYRQMVMDLDELNRLSLAVGA